MSERLAGCENGYCIDELYDKFGMDENELSVCMSCSRCVQESGVISCRYLVEQVSLNITGKN